MEGCGGGGDQPDALGLTGDRRHHEQWVDALLRDLLAADRARAWGTGINRLCQSPSGSLRHSRSLRSTRLADLVNTLDPKLVAAALGKRRIVPCVTRHNVLVALFTCANCEQPLTGDLQESHASPASDHLSDHRIADPRVAQGTYAVNYDASLFILHPDDVPGTALHPDSGRRSGCCGLHGQDGPNLVCAGCGAEVATKESDCWTDNLVALMAAAVVSGTEPPSGTR